MKSFRHSLYTPLYAAADEGKDWAQYELGMRYRDGSDGFDMNLPEGVRYVQMAAEKGFARAQYSLGAMHGKVQGFPVKIGTSHFMLPSRQPIKEMRRLNAVLVMPSIMVVEVLIKTSIRPSYGGRNQLI